MRTSPSFRSRLVGAAASVAFVASTLAASALPAGAQTCPTEGGGTTCFGGQAYCASSGQCYNPPTCTGNQTYSCSACGCVCNTALYPCGGCTAASSTAGATCSSPTGGRYTNQCGTCACPSGTTLCPTSNACIANRACPAGTTWDPCTDTCGTPNVLLSPGFQQNGFVQVSGELRSTAGNLRLDAATGASQGDVYMANGKAIRVDGSGTTSLTFGNYGTGGVAVNLRVLGALFGNGFSTIPSDTTLAAHASGTIETGQICLGNGINCRTTWPSSSDFNPTYVNASGTDAMSGPLTINGAGNNLIVAGGAGAPGTSKVLITAPATNEGLRIVSAADASPFTIRNSGNTADIFRVDQGGTLAAGNVPWARLSGFPSACPAGQFATAVGGTLTCAAPGGLTGSGTAARVPKFTSASAIGDSNIYTSATDVSINTPATEGYALNVQTKATNFGDGIQIHHASQGQKWQLAVLGTGTTSPGSLSIQNNPTGGNRLAITQNGVVGIGTATPDAAVKLHVSGGGIGLDNNQSLFAKTSAGIMSNILFMDSSNKTRIRGLAGGFQIDDSGGNPLVFVNNTGSTGIGTTSPTAKLDVRYSGALGSGNNTAQFYAGTGNYSHVHWGTTGDWYVRSATSSGKVILQDTGGNVGIGTSNPGNFRLNVSSSGDAAYFGSGSSWFKMWTGGNSRLSLGDGSGYEAGFIAGGQNASGQNTISIAACQDGGSCPQYITLNQSGNVGIGDNTPSYDLDVSGTIRATGSIVLGGVSRSSWPSLGGYVQRTDFYTWQGAGWKRVYCPSGYIATGASGYNCESNGGNWECSATVLEDTSVQYYYSAEATAYTWTKCVRLN